MSAPLPIEKGSWRTALDVPQVVLWFFSYDKYKESLGWSFFSEEILWNLPSLFSMLQILINFLQVTGVAVFINVKWTNGVLNTLGVAGKKSDFPLPISKCVYQCYLRMPCRCRHATRVAVWFFLCKREYMRIWICTTGPITNAVRLEYLGLCLLLICWHVVSFQIAVFESYPESWMSFDIKKKRYNTDASPWMYLEISQNSAVQVNIIHIYKRWGLN